MKKWAILIFVALFAGVLTGGMNFGLREQVKNSSHTSRTGIFHSSQTTKANLKEVQGPQTRKPFSDLKNIWKKSNPSNFESFFLEILQSFWSSPIGKAACIFLGFIFIMASWLISRFSFVWLHNVWRREAVVKMPFHQFHKQGRSLFIAALITNFFFIVLIAGALILIGYSVLYSNLLRTNNPVPPLLFLKTLQVPILILGFVTISFVFFYWVVRDFVVPVMAFDQIAFQKGWLAFVSVYQKNRKEFWLYFLITAILAVVTGIIELLIAGIWMIALIFAGGVLFFIPFLIFNVILIQLEFIFWSYAVLVGIPFVFFTIVTSLAIHLPFAVFYRLFSLYFLSSLNSPYQSLMVDPHEI